MVKGNRRLFSWSEVERLPELERLELVLKALPDEELLSALEQRRGRGRDDYPIRAMWRALIAGMVFQHVSVESLLRELRRNPALLDVCGFDPMGPRRRPKRTGGLGPKEVPRGEGVASTWNFSRFLSSVARLEEERGLIAGMTGRLREPLMEEVEDLGDDGKGLRSHSTGRKSRKTGQSSDPEADWGRHETRGKDGRTGRLWRKIRRGFGYRIHLIADTRYEIPVAWRVTRASRSEVKELEAMSEALFQETPKLAKRCQDFSGDRGLDSGPLKETLWDDYGIGPLIEPRELWKEEKKEPGHDPGEAITRPLYPDRADTLVYTEKGEVCCVYPETGEQRRLAFQGFEAKRGRLKYRCPAAAYGFTCAGHAGGRLRPDRADCPCRPGPADLHPDPALQPVLEAGLPAPQCAGADLQPPGQRLRVRAALPAGPEPGDGTGRAGPDGDDGPGPGGTPATHALAGRGGSLRPYRIAATAVLPAITTNETETVGRTEGFADAEMRQAGSRKPLFTAMTPLPSRSGACRRPVAAVGGHLQHQSAAGNPYSACASEPL